MNASAVRPNGYELRFLSLFDPGRSFVFPCDSQGCIALDTMSPPARASYLRVRSMVGREFTAPIVKLAEPPDEHRAPSCD